MSHSSNHFAIVMVVLAGIMWAGSGIGAQNFFEKCSMNAMELTAFRMMAAGFILIGVTVWQGKMKESLICLRKKPRLLIDIVIYATLGLMLMHYTYFEAIAYGNAATATVVLYSCPAMVICYLYNAGLMYLSPQQALITAASEPAASVILSCLIFGMNFVGLQLVGILMVILAIVMPAVDLGKVFGERQ